MSHFVPAGDFTITTQTVTIPAGQLSAPFTVPIADDLIVENSESFDMELMNPSAGTISPTLGTAVGNIVDNDGKNSCPEAIIWNPDYFNSCSMNWNPI